MQSAEINELAKALSLAQSEMGTAKKDSTNPFFKSNYADLASTWDACRAALTKNHLAVVQTTEGDGKSVTVITTLMHSSGQWIRGELTMLPVKTDPQGIGSCVKYARRYALSAMVGIADSDDDGNAFVSIPIKSSAAAAVAILKDPGEYLIPGGTFSGMKVKDVDPEELNTQIEKTIDLHTRKGRPLSVEAKKFIEHADEYLNKNFPDSYQSQLREK